MICPEIVPFAKTGGLADMVGSLAKALDVLGHQVTLVMPAYRPVLRATGTINDTEIRFDVPVGSDEIAAEVLKAESGQRNPRLFHSRGPLLRSRLSVRRAGFRLSRQRRAVHLFLAGCLAVAILRRAVRHPALA